MKPIEFTRSIDASIDEVFQCVSDVRNFRKAIPHITNIEFLTDQQVGTGTRFLETRSMNGREQSVELEVSEFVENDRVRMISEAGGTIWDTVFLVTEDQNNVTLKMKMDVIPQTFFAKIMTRLIRGMVAKAVGTDMDAVKRYCEANTGRSK